ncbi:MAG: phosphoribosyl-ATP diphosphatase [Pseudomonadota bacterium]
MHPIDTLWQAIQDRRGAAAEESYTAALLAKGPAKCAEKFGEEAIEAIIETARSDPEALTREAADVLYHFCVMLAAANVNLSDVMAELERRQGMSGHAEKASR